MFLAQRGVHILALDLSPRMIAIAQARAARELLPNPPEFRVLATEHLSTLEHDGPFDGAFANFAGLNCVDDLSQVADTLGRLLKPKSRLLLCMMGRFVPLEILWFLARRNPRKAFQRLRESRTSYASTTGLVINRPTVRQITRQMKPAFRLVGWKGIGIVVPPSYAEHVARKFPHVIQHLAKVDRRIGPFLSLRTWQIAYCLSSSALITPRAYEPVRQASQDLTCGPIGNPELSRAFDLPIQAPQCEVSVWLHGTGAPRDVTTCHSVACSVPFTLCIRGEGRAPLNRRAALRFHERGGEKRLLGVIELQHEAMIPTGGPALHLYKAVACTNLCLPRLRHWMRST